MAIRYFQDTIFQTDSALSAIGVGKNGLDNWVSDNDVKLLIKWARGFKPKHKF